MLYCFLDTNIFLQYQMFDDVDWPKLLDVENVTLVVTRQVIAELDKHKHDPASNRRRKRSRRVLKKLMVCFEEQEGYVRDNVTLDIQTDIIKSSWLLEHGYDPKNADDCIVGAVHYFRESRNDENVILIGDDYGARLKAKANGVRTIAPPNDLEPLPNEADPLQRENLRLRQELQDLKNALPNLIITIENGDNHSDTIQYEVDFGAVTLNESEVQRELSLQQQELQYDGPASDDLQVEDSENQAPQTVADVLRLRMLDDLPSREDIERYNVLLELYLENEYRNYLIDKSIYEQTQLRTVPIKLLLENVGKAPAEDIDVWLHFPDGFKLLREHELSQIPKIPTPPQKPEPGGYQGLLGGQFNSIPNVSDSLLHRSIFDRDLSRILSNDPPRYSLSIKKTNSYEVNYWAQDLKHRNYLEFERLYLIFEEINEPHTAFEVQYSITAANVPDELTGRLVIHLRRT
jgi:hypothetical protein